MRSQFLRSPLRGSRWLGTEGLRAWFGAWSTKRRGGACKGLRQPGGGIWCQILTQKTYTVPTRKGNLPGDSGGQGHTRIVRVCNCKLGELHRSIIFVAPVVAPSGVWMRMDSERMPSYLVEVANQSCEPRRLDSVNGAFGVLKSVLPSANVRVRPDEKGVAATLLLSFSGVFRPG